MPKVERAGTYRASIAESGIQVNREGERVTSMAFVAKLFCVSRYNTQEKVWEDFPAEPQEITAFLNLIKSNGGMNEAQWNSIEKALEWTEGREKLAVAMMDPQQFAGKEVNVVVELNEYNGKSRLQVAWINSTSGVKAASDDDKTAFVQALAAAGLKLQFDATHGETPF